MIFEDIILSIRQLWDPKFRSVLIKGVGVTVLMLGAVFILGWLIMAIFGLIFNLPIINYLSGGYDYIKHLAFSGFMATATFLMYPVASLFIGFFLEDISSAVEEKYYPNDIGTPIPMSTSIMDAVAFLGVMIFANLVALIIYYTIPILAPFIFLLVNGFLLGREYFQLVAMRHMPRVDAKELRKKFRWKIWVAGILMAIPLSIPFVNLLIPIIGVAIFTHQYHRLVRQVTSD